MIGAVVQARMGSTRLPGKVLMPLAGSTVLGQMITRLERCRMLDQIVVATTELERDRVVVEEAERCGVAVFMGDEQDVLGRYRQAAEAFGLTTVVRVTSDCPLIDPALLDEMVEIFQALHGRIDFLCNNLPPTFPHGLDAEVFSLATLRIADEEARLPEEREHVSPFVRSRPERFRIRGVTQGKNQAKFRITVDTPQDLEVVRMIFQHLEEKNPLFDREDIVAFLHAQPAIAQLNTP